MEKTKITLIFLDNILDAELADMQFISKFNKGFWFLLILIGIYNKYTWVITLKDKRGIAITNAKKVIKWIYSQTEENVGR